LDHWYIAVLSVCPSVGLSETQNICQNTEHIIKILSWPNSPVILSCFNSVMLCSLCIFLCYVLNKDYLFWFVSTRL